MHRKNNIYFKFKLTFEFHVKEKDEGSFLIVSDKEVKRQTKYCMSVLNGAVYNIIYTGTFVCKG